MNCMYQSGIFPHFYSERCSLLQLLRCPGAGFARGFVARLAHPRHVQAGRLQARLTAGCPAGNELPRQPLTPTPGEHLSGVGVLLAPCLQSGIPAPSRVGGMAMEATASRGLTDYGQRLEARGAWGERARSSRMRRDAVCIPAEGSSPLDVLARSNSLFPARQGVPRRASGSSPNFSALT